jgi:hypothetical protein
METPYECDPFDFTPCVQYSGLGPEPEVEPGTEVLPVCPMCPAINRVATGLIILDLALLIFTVVAVKFSKKR